MTPPSRFKIGEACFQNASAKDASVRDRLAIKDCSTFLKTGGCAARFAPKMP